MDIIKSSAEISNLFENGQRINTPFFTLIVLSDGKQHGRNGRAAFVAGKRNGNAVWRNRAKRRMRALFRDSADAFDGMDAVFLARRNINDASYDDLSAYLRKAVKRAHK